MLSILNIPIIMHPQDLADHNKNKPRQQFIICRSWYLGFIHKSKYFKKQKNSKSQKTDFLSFWELQQLAKVRDVHPVDQDLILGSDIHHKMVL